MPTIKHNLDGFINMVNAKDEDVFHIVYGLKAAPLTLAHEEIIRKCVSDFVEKYKNIHLRIEVADSMWKNDFKTVDMVREFAEQNLPSNASLQDRFGTAGKTEWFNDRIRVEAQDCWRGVYGWLKQNRFEGSRTLIVVGEDEWNDLSSDYSTWTDADKLVNEYYVCCMKNREDNDISASKVRTLLYRDPDISYMYVRDMISKWTYDWIKSHGFFWQLKRNYRAEENNFIRNYNPGRFERPSVTVDNVVWYDDGVSKYVLLIRRGGHPYKGFWALPGGFLDVNDDPDLESAALRELREETGIKKSDGNTVLHPVQFKTYADIGTDPRTRIVDVVYGTKVDMDVATKVKANDDAIDACWFSLDNLPKLAFNHEQIINEYFRSVN